MASAEDLSALRDEVMRDYNAKMVDLDGRQRHEASMVRGEIETLKKALKEAELKAMELQNKMSNIENAKEKKEKSLVYIKNMTPFKLEKQEDWRRWKDEVLDYCDEVFDGMKDKLEMVRKEAKEIPKEKMEEEWWGRGETLAKFLKKYAGGDAYRVVMAVGGDYGWEMWRKINNTYEPNMAVKQAQTMSQFTSMVNKRAKNLQETKALIMELEEKQKIVEEVLGEGLGEGHAASVIMGVLDQETMKYVSQDPLVMSNPRELKRKALEFVNMMVGPEDSSKKGFATSLDEKGAEEEEIMCQPCDWESNPWDYADGTLYGFGREVL